MIDLVRTDNLAALLGLTFRTLPSLALREAIDCGHGIRDGNVGGHGDREREQEESKRDRQ